MHLGVAIVALVLCVTLVHCEAQVTFSAGWNPGKRNGNPDAGYAATIGGIPPSVGRNMHPMFKSVASICRLLLNQIRDLANCEASKYEPRGSDVKPVLFEQLNK